VFIRAGLSGTTNWVPRVTRDRQQLCGFRPTFGGTAPAPIAPPATVTAQAAAPSTPAAAPTTAPAEAPAPRTYSMAEVCQGRSGTLDGFINRATGAPVVCPGAPAVAQVAAPAPEPGPVADPFAGVRRLSLADACAEMAATGRAMRDVSTGALVVCPTPAPPPVMTASVTPPPASSRGNGAQMSVVYQGFGNVPVPVAAPAHMAQPVISCTYMRQLQNDYGLIFPADTQCSNTPAPTATATRYNAAGNGLGAAVGTQSHGFGAAIPASNPPAGTPVPAIPEGYRAVWTDGRLNPNRGPNPHVASAPQMSTRSVVPSAPAASGQRYVQVGTFAEAANARNATAVLIGAGLPAARGSLTRGGRAMTVVLAGPFASQVELMNALATARSAGFNDAFLRR